MLDRDRDGRAAGVDPRRLVLRRDDLGGCGSTAKCRTAALRVKHLDLNPKRGDVGWITVDEAVFDVGGRLITGTPKTARSRRKVSIESDICSMLKAHLGDRRVNPEAYVFVGHSPQQAQWNHGNFRARFWKEALNGRFGFVRTRTYLVGTSQLTTLS